MINPRRFVLSPQPKAASSQVVSSERFSFASCPSQSSASGRSGRSLIPIQRRIFLQLRLMLLSSIGYVQHCCCLGAILLISCNDPRLRLAGFIDLALIYPSNSLPQVKWIRINFMAFSKSNCRREAPIGMGYRTLGAAVLDTHCSHANISQALDSRDPVSDL